MPVPPLSDAIAWYDANVASAVARSEAHDAAELNCWLMNLLPQAPAVINYGCPRRLWPRRRSAGLAPLQGSGRRAVRCHVRRGGPAASGRKYPLAQRPPAEPGGAPIRAGLSVDAILSRAVWMHVPPPDRLRAFRKLVSLLRPCGTTGDYPARRAARRARVRHASREPRRNRAPRRRPWPGHGACPPPAGS